MSATTIERAEIAIPDHTVVDAPTVEPGQPESGARLSAKPRTTKRRGALLVTVAAVALVAATAAGVYYIGQEPAQPTRPAVTAASPPVSHIGSTTTAASLARAPAPARVTPLPAVPSEDGDDMASFLRAGGHPLPVPVDTHAIPPSPVPVPVQGPESVPLQPIKPAPAEEVPMPPSTAVAVPVATPDGGAADGPRGAALAMKQAAAPAPSATVAVPPPPIAVTPDNAADVAAKLVPGRMTDAEQIQVLDLVTKLGTLVRNQNIRIAELQGTVSGLQSRVSTSLTDFGRRLTLAEATGAMNSAAATPTSLPSPALARTVDVGAPGASRVVVRSSPATSAPAETGSHRYHVQAASPGLAMLSELDASGGEEAQLPVAPGDNLPGYGKVISISQRGSAWVVKAQNGLIQ